MVLPKPYFETDLGKLYHGDCLEILHEVGDNESRSKVQTASRYQEESKDGKGTVGVSQGGDNVAVLRSQVANPANSKLFSCFATRHGESTKASKNRIEVSRTQWKRKRALQEREADTPLSSNDRERQVREMLRNKESLHSPQEWGSLRQSHNEPSSSLHELPQQISQKNVVEKEKILCIADPPYGMSFQSNHRFNKHPHIVGDDHFDVEAIMKLIKISSCAAYIFCRWDNLYLMPKPKSVMAWIKNNWSMGDLKHEHGRQWEAICFYPGDNHEFYKRIPDVIHSNRTGNNLHPTQKPVGLISTIISSNKSDVVLDPYLGSGTTAIACENLVRRWIGIEISEKYCEIAAKRIEAESRQLKLF